VFALLDRLAKVAASDASSPRAMDPTFHLADGRQVAGGFRWQGIQDLREVIGLVIGPLRPALRFIKLVEEFGKASGIRLDRGQPPRYVLDLEACLPPLSQFVLDEVA
jgi:hypothetical protein